ncbi:MAG: baseplate J/gp47 family protein [Anaerolineae bacterium]|nr:baseplate J/gp47 family protein [Anaerolineae bacterium]MDW8098261.1 baseplate J/gp47 family protein [Anaerolineae bacterium]
MTQFIHLNDDWQTPGLLARLDAADDGMVVLVVPTHSRMLANSARLQVIRRRAAQRQMRIALVSSDPTTRRLAAEAGLPAYRSVAEAAQAECPAPPANGHLPEDPQPSVRAELVQWRAQRARERAHIIARHRPRPTPVWVETAGLMVILAALTSLVMLVTALIVPGAYVTLVPSQQTVAVTVDLTATTGVDYPDFNARLIPARRIEVQIEGNGSLPTTGRRDVPDQRATGTVLFINRQATPQEIPLGTVVRTSTGTNVRFRTTASAILGPGVGTTVAVPVEAVDPGPSGNVRSGTITQVDGPLAPLVRVINEQPTSGGTVRQASVVTNADKDRLRQAVLQQVRQTAYQRLSELLQDGEFLPPESISTLILAETFDHFLDEPADTLGLRLRVLARGLAVNGAAGEQIAHQAMQAQIPGRARVLADRVRYQPGPVTVLEERVMYSLTATGEIVSDIDKASVRAAIVGLPLDEARAVLAREWPLAAPPEIRLEPDWIGRVPWVPFRIRVQVDWTGSLGQ